MKPYGADQSRVDESHASVAAISANCEFQLRFLANARPLSGIPNFRCGVGSGLFESHDDVRLRWLFPEGSGRHMAVPQ